MAQVAPRSLYGKIALFLTIRSIFFDSIDRNKRSKILGNRAIKTPFSGQLNQSTTDVTQPWPNPDAPEDNRAQPTSTWLLHGPASAHLGLYRVANHRFLLLVAQSSCNPVERQTRRSLYCSANRRGAGVLAAVLEDERCVAVQPIPLLPA